MIRGSFRSEQEPVAMKHMPQVVAVMTPFPYSVDMHATVFAAQELMRKHRFRHLPVVENGELRGVLTERDIRSALGHNPGFNNAEQLAIRDIFEANAYATEADTPLDVVAAHMAQHHVDAALVTKAGKLVGVFTANDACRALAVVLHERFPPPSPGTEAA
jgi:acetoin utilization protein AcuB